MKTFLMYLSLGLLISFSGSAWAQSTTGGRSGGSTASTGAGYETTGKRPAETGASSMTIADEGSQRGYMYVPPGAKPNRASSPDGSGAGQSKTASKPSAGTTVQPATDNKKPTRREQ